MTTQKDLRLSAFSLLVVLVCAVAVSTSLLNAQAHDPPWSFPTCVYQSVSPNPVGINQQVLVTMWIDKVPPTARGDSGDRWKNFSVDVTTPERKLENYGPFESDSAGSTYFLFTPKQAGTYTFQLTATTATLGTFPYPKSKGSTQPEFSTTDSSAYQPTRT
jgi:hypothetical protein